VKKSQGGVFWCEEKRGHGFGFSEVSPLAGGSKSCSCSPWSKKTRGEKGVVIRLTLKLHKSLNPGCSDRGKTPTKVKENGQKGKEMGRRGEETRTCRRDGRGGEGVERKRRECAHIPGGALPVVRQPNGVKSWENIRGDSSSQNIAWKTGKKRVKRGNQQED